jgi:glutathione S-transferase
LLARPGVRADPGDGSLALGGHTLIGWLLLLAGLAAAVARWSWEKSQRKTHPVPPGLQADIDLPYQQEFELYHNAFSLCSMKTRVGMAELGVPYESHHIDLIETGSYENISSHFLAVNPAGTVPVLVHNGHPVYESHEQIRYAADHAPAGSPRLVPEDPALREEMQRWIDRSSLTGDPLRHGGQSAGNAVPGQTAPIFAAMIGRIPYRNILEGLLFHFDRRRPLIFLTFKFRGLEKLPRLKPVMKALMRTRDQMHVHMDALDEQLRASRGPWILGDVFSLADVSWLVIFQRLVQVDALHVFTGEGLRPECTAYWRRLTERPSYREAILEHSHPTIRYGTERLQKAKAVDPELRLALEGRADSGRG